MAPFVVGNIDKRLKSKETKRDVDLGHPTDHVGDFPCGAGAIRSVGRDSCFPVDLRDIGGGRAYRCILSEN